MNCGQLDRSDRFFEGFGGDLVLRTSANRTCPALGFEGPVRPVQLSARVERIVGSSPARPKHRSASWPKQWIAEKGRETRVMKSDTKLPVTLADTGDHSSFVFSSGNGALYFAVIEAIERQLDEK